MRRGTRLTALAAAIAAGVAVDGKTLPCC